MPVLLRHHRCEPANLLNQGSKAHRYMPPCSLALCVHHMCVCPYCRALEEARAKVAELHQQRRLANLSVPDEGGDGEGGEGGKAAAKSRKRKKGAAAAAADEAFYVDDDTPIERLPKKNVKVGWGVGLGGRGGGTGLSLELGRAGCVC